MPRLQHHRMFRTLCLLAAFAFTPAIQAQEQPAPVQEVDDVDDDDGFDDWGLLGLLGLAGLLGRKRDDRDRVVDARPRV